MVSLFGFIFLVPYFITLGHSLTFSIQTASTFNPNNSTLSIATLTLYWGASIHQCTVYPIQSSTSYTCNTNSSALQCEPIKSNWRRRYIPDYGLQIDNIGDIPLIIASVVINNGSVYIYNQFKYFQGLTTAVEIDTETDPSHTLYFTRDTTIDSNIATVYDYSANQFAQCIPIGYSCSPTPVYGVKTGDLLLYNPWTMNQGRINGINSWGLDSANHLMNVQWTSDLKGLSTVYPNKPSVYPLSLNCTGFALDDDNYIHGYRVTWSVGGFLCGMGFYTLKGSVFECWDPAEVDTCGYEDSGEIILKHHVLSGFAMHYLIAKKYDPSANMVNSYSAGVVEIGLQFTSILNDDCPAVDKYALVPLKMKWTEANIFCNQQYGTHLVSIIDEQDLRIAKAIRINNGYFPQNIWIGLMSNSTNSWTWTGATSCNYTSTSSCKDDLNWSFGKPGETGNCAILGADGRFHNTNCSDKNIFYCAEPVTFSPTINPSLNPTSTTNYPTSLPTTPTTMPTNASTSSPTTSPSDSPIAPPTAVTLEPTQNPSKFLTQQTMNPSTTHNKGYYKGMYIGCPLFVFQVFMFMFVVNFYG